MSGAPKHSIVSIGTYGCVKSWCYTKEVDKKGINGRNEKHTLHRRIQENNRRSASKRQKLRGDRTRVQRVHTLSGFEGQNDRMSCVGILHSHQLRQSVLPDEICEFTQNKPHKVDFFVHFIDAGSNDAYSYIMQFIVLSIMAHNIIYFYGFSLNHLDKGQTMCYNV